MLARGSGVPSFKCMKWRVGGNRERTQLIKVDIAEKVVF